MNVLAIIHAPLFTGPHNTMTVAAKLLQPQGINITVVLPEEATEAAERIRSQGVDVITLPLHRARTVPDPRVQYTWARTLRTEVAHIAEIVRERKFDLVVTHTLPNLHGPLAARKADVALVWEIIDTYPPAAFRKAWMPLVTRMSDAILTTGTKVAEEHPGTTAFGDRWVPYFPCVDVERFRADPAVRAAARKELGLPDDVTVIGNVAAISEMKGHKWLIRAAAKVRATHPDTRFVILGGQFPGKEEYYASLWGEAESLGLKLGEDLVVADPGKRVSELAQAFDMFWMTSEPRSEGIPTVIGEAKSLGLPVVATDVGSTAECVTDGVSGFLVPAQDPDAIANAARKILDDPELSASMGRVGRTEAENQYAAERGAAQHRLAFERAIAHHAQVKAQRADNPGLLGRLRARRSGR